MTPRRITCLATLTLLCIGPMNAEVAAQTTQDEKLPDAEALLQKMVKAMGGEKTIRKHTHQKLTGTFEMPAMGISAELVSYGAKPNLAVTHIEIVGMGGVHQGVRRQGRLAG